MMTLTGYQISETLYQGTRTEVYRGTRTRDRIAVIIKVLRNPNPSFNELVQFRNQYTITKHLEHPGIVRPLALERYGNGYALIMPDSGAVSGSHAVRLIAFPEYWQQCSASLSEFLNIAIQLADALHYLTQQRIIHKDIKPGNILICPETHQIKLIDFSISSLLPKEEQQLINPNVLEGTLAYISPEQTGRMNRGIDYRTDFYSLGVTFYEMLVGQLPFTTTDPMELVHCHIAKTPIPPHTLHPTPDTLSEIVLKLMAKNAEDRYQSALGLKHDLEQCLQQWETTGEIIPFEIGKRDICDRFSIPEKLYGREQEVAQLLAAFNRVASSPSSLIPTPDTPNPSSELLLVAGFSGIGKTAIVNEVHKPIVRQRGYFIKGKFDQFNRNIPFSAFVQAFRDLMGQLLAESDSNLKQWKAKIIVALGEQGQVIIEVIPELEKIIGKQPVVPELAGSAAQNRFNLLFGKFIGVFTTKEHPLVIFLDDLQWADLASLNLLKLLMDSSEIGYLLVLGAYRDNEVFPAHPLMLTLDAIAKLGENINTLTLAPLHMVDITQLVADTLRCSTKVATPLSQLVYEKTRGNPFFTTQFLVGLHEDGYITFDEDTHYWQCDLTEVRQLALTDDVVEFIVRRLGKLPETTQDVLKLAACIGNQFDLTMLAIACDRRSEEIAASLWTGLQEGFVIPKTENYKFFQAEDSRESSPESVSVSYRFLHDRVQQAAYSLIPDDQKQSTHYHIGKLLLQKIHREAREEQIFDIVGQLNYGIALISEQTERDELAALNLIACRKSRAATAYQLGREYASAGLSLLGENAWTRQYKMSLAFHEFAVELAWLCSDFEAMEHFQKIALDRAYTSVEKVNIYRIKILATVSQNQLSEAIDIAREFLQQLGFQFSITPTQKHIQEAIAEISTLIGNREIEELIHLPLMTHPKKIAILQIINSIMPAVFISNPSLFPLLVCSSVNLSIQYGNTSASAYSYSCYSMIICNMLQDVNTGVKFGDLALQVVSKLNAKAVQPEVFSAVGLFILHRKSHIQKTLPILQEAYAVALEVGNQDMAGYNSQNFCLNSFWSGQSLATLEQEIGDYCNSLVQFNQLTVANWCRIYWQSTLNLLGMVKSPSILSGKAVQETELLPQMLKANDLFGLYFFFLYKLMLCYLFGEMKSAQVYAVESKGYLMAGAGTVGEPAFYFYDSLRILAVLNSESEETLDSLQQVRENQTKLQQHWANYAPMNYQHKWELVEAEKYRVLGKRYEAGDFYDRAISLAKDNEYIQEEALANELAAKFYLDWGKEKIAAVYMTDAYYGYARWGAKAKTDQLEAQYPQLLTGILQQQYADFNEIDRLNNLTQTISATIQTQSSTTSLSDTLDFVSLLKAGQILSSTIEINPLLAEISRIILTNAGAQKAVLLIPQDSQWQLRAIAKLTSDGRIKTSTEAQPLTVDSPVPIRLINYVKNTQTSVVINQAKTEITGILEGYLLNHKPQSVLCLPLLNQGKLVAILYLEHPTTKGVFTPHRQTVVEFLCTQAAISLKNAQLYEQAQEALRDLQQAQLQLVQSEKMSALGNLVAGVAHEINNPTGFLQGNIEPAKEYVQDLLGLIDLFLAESPQKAPAIEEKLAEIDLDFIREDLPDLLGSMNQGVERIRNISNSLRTFSRKDEEQKTTFKLDEGIDSTLLILKHRTKANEHRPEIQIIKDYAEIPEVQCFPGQLNQVFMNILANAIDAFEEANQGKTYAEIKQNPNRIEISISQLDESQVQIQIKDNGGGMKTETQERIFEQGFTTKEVGKGTGLGMAIAHQIVTEKHGGTITCTSELGKGTEFAIAIPIGE